MPAQLNTTGPGLKLTSQVFDDGTQIPAAYTCKGQNINPPLSITGVPAGTKCLALIMHDPDAVLVVGFDFVHWLVWDIPSSTKIINASSVPGGSVQGQNDTKNAEKNNSYIGPRPPAGTGTHHYLFELYAMDKTLGLPPTTNRDQLQKAMAGHILAQHTLTGLFSAD